MINIAVRGVVALCGAAACALTLNWGWDRETTTRDVRTYYNAASDTSRPTYKWRGEIFRSCPVELRRWVEDNAGVRHELPPLSPPPRLRWALSGWTGRYPCRAKPTDQARSHIT